MLKKNNSSGAALFIQLGNRVEAGRVHNSPIRDMLFSSENYKKLNVHLYNQHYLYTCLNVMLICHIPTQHYTETILIAQFF